MAEVDADVAEVVIVADIDAEVAAVDVVAEVESEFSVDNKAVVDAVAEVGCASSNTGVEVSADSLTQGCR